MWILKCTRMTSGLRKNYTILIPFWINSRKMLFTDYLYIVKYSWMASILIDSPKVHEEFKPLFCNKL